MGTLQIADMGLARFHEKDANTGLRLVNNIHTSTPSGTSRYEPPEMDRDRATPGGGSRARSRQYDIWSMGCVMLELLIWLCYDYEAVETFRKNTKYFWQPQKDRYVVHDHVVSCMNVMDTQLQDNTAHKELLDLVRTKLLIVKVSETYESQLHFREIAKGFRKSMEDIEQKCRPSSSYFLIPVRLENFPSEDRTTHPQPGIVHENEIGLAVPPLQRDIPRTLPTPPLPPNSSLEKDNGFSILVSSPTLENNSDSLSGESRKVPDHQEVGELNHPGSMNLQG